MKFAVALLFALAILPSVAAAQARNETYNWLRYAVGTQPLNFLHAGHVRKNCEPIGQIRMVLPVPPQNGKVEAIQKADFVEFGNKGAFRKCSERRTPGITVIYRATEGYRGSDRFSFQLVYSDGSTRRYNVDMTIY
ncbi:MAG: hypothetical protein IOB85_03850 [Methylobacterium sp.]|jgi:hypothetical protein|nr:hypothetical protein [Methylobacterium sp.]MCA3654979.1 hypothetical protein [Methylobacterium sp.]MCA3657419.1 hypothetical protein [Methylobacterium sp.]MCA3661749.1 hypothetical protein [Methylobacterium sp.]MCA3662257.1 hypothetical protein [Methylobacterium sp.]